ncbi:pyridoxal kinase-like [Anneissia japonica]|uniref:pyridoxal kinase-like n=1 Tax=Anneissia japonica TaxID=1529436 RepID=UPI001425927C|nr:pyridoxal kinase-like [Anneissia japonica]
MSVHDRRVLSVQSHVVSGYVGNKAAVFPMQVLGYEVDFINSVQLCTHTQYELIKGQVLNADELKCLYDGIKGNGINRYSHLLTGYVGSTSFLHEVIRVVKDARDANANMTYVCDPVMGDNGRFYVPEDLMPIYRDELLPLADIVTPNQFEAELLSGMKITNEVEALKAMQTLHDKGVKTVVLSSYETGKEDTLTLLGTQLKNGKKTGCKIEYPKLNMRFTGTGDVFSALLLVWTHKYPDNLQLACEQVISTMQGILQRTYKEAQLLAGPGGTPSPAQSELRLIDSKVDIENPCVQVKGVALSF